MRSEAKDFLDQLEKKPFIEFHHDGWQFQGIVKEKPSKEEMAESSALNFIVKNDNDDDKTTIYRPSIVLSGVIFPNRELVDDSMIGYWKNRYSTTANEQLKFRYGDLVLDFTTKSKDWTELANEQAGISIQLLQISYEPATSSEETSSADDSSETVAKANFITSSQYYIKRLLQFCVILKDNTLTTRAIDSILQFVKTNLASIKWLPYFIFSELNANEYVFNKMSDEQKGIMVSALEDQIKAATDSAENFFSYDDAVLSICRYFAKCNNEAKVKEFLEIAEEGLKSNEYLNSRAMLKVSSLEKLIAIYSEFRKYDFAKAAQSRLEAELLEAAAGQEDEMQSFTVEHTLTGKEKKALDDLAASIFKPIEGLSLADSVIAKIFSNFLPKKNDIEESLKNIKSSNPLHFLFSTSIIGDDGLTIAKVQGEDDDGHFVQHYTQNIQFSHFMFGRPLNDMRSKVPVEQVKDIFISSPVYNERDSDVIDHILKAYWEGDNLAFSSVAIPYIESSLRFMHKANGIPVLRPSVNEYGGYEYASMGSLLNEDLLKAIFSGDKGADLYTFIKITMLDSRGLNLRNNLSHGINLASFQSQFVTDVVFLVLMTFLVIKKNDDGEEAKANT